MTIKNRFILTLICGLGLSSIQTGAQTFQGEFNAVSFNNIDAKIQKYSSGVGYNGAEESTFYCKGNKVLVNDKSLLYAKLFDPDNNIVILYCEGLGKGLSVDYDEYLNCFATFSKKEREFMGYKMPPFTLYELNVTNDNLEAFGHKAEFIKGRLENKYAGTEMDFEIIPSIKISEALNLAMIFGVELDGLPIKFRWTQDNQSKALGRMKSYMGIEVTSLTENNDLDDTIFEVPKNVKVKKGEAKDVSGFLQEIGKYLKKNNFFPDQRGEEITYELNEAEWDY